MASRVQRLASAIGDAWKQLNRADAQLLAAGLSFYVFLSTAPLALASAVLLGFFLGQQEGQTTVLEFAERGLGPRGSEAVQLLIDSTAIAGDQWWLVASALVVALYGASRTFLHLQTALNRVFGVRQQDASKLGPRLRRLVAKRAISVGLVSLVAVAIVLASALDSVLSAVAAFGGEVVTTPVLTFALGTIGTAAVLCGFLTVAYRVLPDVELAWRDAAVGALGAGLAMTLVAKLLSAFLVQYALRSVSAAASTVTVTLLWLYVSALVLLFGAQLSAASAVRGNRTPKPDEGAERIEEGRLTT